ncbi:MAG: hypothetical protein J6Y78_08990 [Paludibacteraceae bacterium]|nr:hypothetical protein [Paludibacteraceae bacterium]
MEKAQVDGKLIMMNEKGEVEKTFKNLGEASDFLHVAIHKIMDAIENGNVVRGHTFDWVLGDTGIWVK